MIHTETMTPIQIQKSGLEVLARELGPYGLVCFLQQFETGAGDYTAERHHWLSHMDTEDVLARVAASRTHESPKTP